MACVQSVWEHSKRNERFTGNKLLYVRYIKPDCAFIARTSLLKKDCMTAMKHMIELQILKTSSTLQVKSEHILPNCT